MFCFLSHLCKRIENCAPRNKLPFSFFMLWLSELQKQNRKKERKKENLYAFEIEDASETSLLMNSLKSYVPVVILDACRMCEPLGIIKL